MKIVQTGKKKTALPRIWAEDQSTCWLWIHITFGIIGPFGTQCMLRRQYRFSMICNYFFQWFAINFSIGFRHLILPTEIYSLKWHFEWKRQSVYCTASRHLNISSIEYTFFFAGEIFCELTQRFAQMIFFRLTFRKSTWMSLANVVNQSTNNQKNATACRHIYA